MKEYKTNPGQAYVVTAVTVPCVVNAVMTDDKRAQVALVDEAGQGSFIAIADKVEVSQDDAVLTPVFKGAPIGLSAKGGGMRDAVVPEMTAAGVDLIAGVCLSVVAPSNNLFIKSFSKVGEMRLILTAESGGVLNVMAPIALKWLNGNKTHYVNAGDRVAVSICNGLATVGSYS